MILQAGGDPKAHHDDPITIAARRGHTKIAALLLQAGATALPSPRAHFSNTHLDPLSHAAEQGHLEIVKMLLVSFISIISLFLFFSSFFFLVVFKLCIIQIFFLYGLCQYRP